MSTSFKFPSRLTSLKTDVPEYKVKVSMVSQKQIDRYSKRKGSRGLWDDNVRTLYILKTLSMGDQIEIFLHELEHAWTDWKQTMMDEANYLRKKAIVKNVQETVKAIDD